MIINGKKAAKMMTRDLPQIIDEYINNFDKAAVNSWIETASIQQNIRLFLKESSYCCFVANGSILPRLNGTQLPQGNSIPFSSPDTDKIIIKFNNEKIIAGMGIKKGVTVITGGGYSGKSTLLDAIAVGVYNHIPGDGREYVVTDESAVKISAEDGRSIKKVDLSPFIKWLPSSDVRIFSTAHASGSTSQAANIMEAIDFGSRVFLIDEDKSATNFMIRDSRMKQLIKREPIIPFTDRVQQLFNETGISTILVIGGSGEYLEIADNIILMDEFIAYNFTNEAKAICNSYLGSYIQYNEYPINWYNHRKILREGFTPYPEEQGTERFDVVEMDTILIGDEKLDVRMLHGIISHAQLNALAYMLRSTEVKASEDVIDVEEVVSMVFREIQTKGLDSVFTSVFLTERWLELPRKTELIAAINRMRNIEFISGRGEEYDR